jgi:phosphopantetheinyl transferase
MLLVEAFWTAVHEPGSAVERFLSDVERRRIQDMRFPLRRQSFVLGRLAAKQVLQLHPACRGVSPTQITVANRPEGAPYALVEGMELDVSISISHSRETAVSAFLAAPGFSIGIDLEELVPRARAFQLDFFTAGEVAFVGALPDAEQVLWANCIWSAKEAVLKAMGTGLRMDSRSVAISPGGSPPESGNWQQLAVRYSGIAAESCRVFWRPFGRFVLTLAVLCHRKPVVPFTVRISQHGTLPSSPQGCLEE